MTGLCLLVVIRVDEVKMDSRITHVPRPAPATTSPQAIAEPKLLMGYEKAGLGLETQRSQTDRR